MDAKEFMSFDQTLNLIKAVGNTRTVLVMGENGVGKTSLHKAMCMDSFFDNHHKIPPIDCTQLSDGSIWGPDIDRERGVYRELPNDRLGVDNFNHRGAPNARPVLGMFDEIAKIPQYVKNMIAPILYERRVGTLLMPEGSVWFAATNLSAENLGDSLAAHLRNRLIVVKMRKPTADEWINNFAIPNRLHPALIACCQENSQVFDSFVDYRAGGKFAGKDLSKDNPFIYNPDEMQDAYASPRSLHAASDLLYATDGLDSTMRDLALEGTVGKPFASVLASFIRFGQQVTPIAEIKADPENARVPSNKIAQQVQVFQFISRADTRDDATAFCKYILRLQPEIQSLFCRRVSESSRVGMFSSITEFGRMMSDNRIFYKV